jgi:hypothetical protein
LLVALEALDVRRDLVAGEVGGEVDQRLLVRVDAEVPWRFRSAK